MTFIVIDADTLIDVGRMGAGTSLGAVSAGFFAAAIQRNSERAAPRIAAPGGRASTSTDGAFLDQVDWFRAPLIDRSTQREPDCQRPLSVSRRRYKLMVSRRDTEPSIPNSVNSSTSELRRGIWLPETGCWHIKSRTPFVREHGEAHWERCPRFLS